MLTLKKVAVTGGLSCGKSVACQFFKELGAYIVNADEIVHQLLSPQTPIGQKVILLLGDDVLVNGQLDRSKIAKKVFNNQALLQSLQEILHPAVLNEIEKQYQKIKEQSNVRLFVAEVPLLFEISGEVFFDVTVAVHADAKLCKQRFMSATGYDENEYKRRMAQQMPSEEKAKRADYIIENTGTLEQMHRAVKTIFYEIISPTS